MGNSIASSVATSMAEKQKAVQREMQPEIAQLQLRNMLKVQERMRRMMMVQQMAMARERLEWMVGFWGVLTAGLVGMAFKNPTALKMAMLPYLGFSTFTAYTWDFAYNTKAERINKMAEQIMTEEHWFLPLNPSDEENPFLRTNNKTQA